MNELHLFAGVGGGILASQSLGHRCVCAVEWEPYAQAILLARQNDGTFPPFPIWSDVRTFDGRTWRGIVDVVCGGFPCQDISIAGTGDGLDGERSGMWHEMARIISEVRPRYAFIENSPMLTSRGLDRVLCDLAAMGFDAEWGVISAAECGALHRRERIWVLAANTNSDREQQQERPEREVWGRTCNGSEELADTVRQRSQGSQAAGNDGADKTERGNKQSGGRSSPLQWRSWPAEPGMGRMVDGMAHRSNRLKAIGNGQVPRVAQTAFTILMERINEQV